MFNVARKEVASRLMTVHQFLSVVASIEAQKPIEAATCKGLLFVQMYAIYEYAVHLSVQASLSYVKNGALSVNDLRTELLSLVLNPLWEATAKAGRRRLWRTRIEVTSMFGSQLQLVDLDDTLFPTDGSHYRPAQLYTIWEVFGISQPIVPNNRLLGRIEEIVENRNAIAHGRRTPEDVGRQYSRPDIEKRIDDVRAITNYIIDTMDKHCSTGSLSR